MEEGGRMIGWKGWKDGRGGRDGRMEKGGRMEEGVVMVGWKRE
jgi:hypothetical protein